jgi:hypothetical protein
MAFHRGPDALRKLCVAVGIDPDKEPVTKLVIECDGEGDVMKVVVTRCLLVTEFDEVVRLIESGEVKR